jgi:putative colanic acid biosynthesis acetyltransferase WcaF
MTVLNAKDHRALEGGPSFSLGHRAFRALWGFTWLLLAAWTPPPLHRWRAWLLGLFGADMHPGARVYGKARVWYPPNLTMHAYAVLGPGANCYCMDKITICEKAVVSQGAQLCAGTHDITDPNFQLITKPIVIGAHAWIAADAFVGPGVSVNEGAVVGARAVLFKDAESWSVYGGNPAKLIKRRVLRDAI